MTTESTRHSLALQRLRESKCLEALDATLGRSVGPQNVFGIAPRVMRQETLHSDILAWLLDERGSHDFGGHFAHEFVKRLLPSPERNLQIEIDIPGKEFSTSRGPIDILLKARVGGHPMVIGIENKIDASETNDQLARYRLGLSSIFKDRPVHLVFLTLDGHKPTNAHPQCPPVCVD